MAALDRLITDAKETLDFHRARGRAGQIEVLATRIRLKALEDARRALQLPTD